MIFKFNPKSILKFFGIPILFYFTFTNINILDTRIKAEKKILAATEEDLYLYKGMGASYLCIASKADIEFTKLNLFYVF